MGRFRRDKRNQRQNRDTSLPSASEEADSVRDFDIPDLNQVDDLHPVTAPLAYQEQEYALNSTEPEALVRDFSEDNTSDNLASSSENVAAAPRKRRNVNPRFNLVLLFLVALLIVMGVALLMAASGTLPEVARTWWPLLILLPGALWLLIALIRRSANAMLISTLVIGFGGSLLLMTKTGTPVGSTLVGVVMITVGTGILFRGLLLGQQPVR